MQVDYKFAKNKKGENVMKFEMYGYPIDPNREYAWLDQENLRLIAGDDEIYVDEVLCDYDPDENVMCVCFVRESEQHCSPYWIKEEDLRIITGVDSIDTFLYALEDMGEDIYHSVMPFYKYVGGSTYIKGSLVKKFFMTYQAVSGIKRVVFCPDDHFLGMLVFGY